MSHETRKLAILPGRKFAVFALSTAETLDLPTPVSLGDDLWVDSRCPIPMPDPWPEWLGKLRSDEVHDASLFLVATSPSENLDDLDGENKALTQRLNRLLFGLLVACPFTPNLAGNHFTGSAKPDGLDVREFGTVPPILRSAGSPWVTIDRGRLEHAASLACAIRGFEGPGEFDRGWRITHAFLNGVREAELGPRLHQFVRVLEGFVYPSAGDTTRQFKSRTELFIGPRHHVLAERLYRIRSSVEHIHRATQSLDGSREEAGMVLAEAAFVAGAIAHYCLDRLLSRARLLPAFRTDDALAAFWAKNPEEKRLLWGDPLDIDQVLSQFQPQYVNLV